MKRGGRELLDLIPRACDNVNAMSENGRNPGAVYFDAVLRPHRSLTPFGFRVLMGVTALLSLAVGSFFFAIGAWPIPGFLGLDILLLYGAFRASYRAARAYETVRLTDAELDVEKVDAKGRGRNWRFEPYWVRVHMDEPPRLDSELTLTSHGRQVVLGGFLTPQERLEVAQALRGALFRQRRGAV